MKYLILILMLLPINIYAQTEIVVTKIINGNIIASDFGDSVTIEKLKAKMLAKREIDITDVTKYVIVVTDRTQEIADAKQAKIDAKTERKAIKKMKSDINASSLPGWHKRILKTLIKELRD